MFFVRLGHVWCVYADEQMRQMQQLAKDRLHFTILGAFESHPKLSSFGFLQLRKLENENAIERRWNGRLSHLSCQTAYEREMKFYLVNYCGLEIFEKRMSSSINGQNFNESRWKNLIFLRYKKIVYEFGNWHEVWTKNIAALAHARSRMHDSSV